MVWDPGAHLGSTALHVFELRGSLYTKSSARYFESLGLGLIEWDGVFEGCESRWLRWCDAKGKVLPTGAERADQERDRADQERDRAERLTERLRALGIDPDAG